MGRLEPVEMIVDEKINSNSYLEFKNTTSFVRVQILVQWINNMIINKSGYTLLTIRLIKKQIQIRI